MPVFLEVAQVIAGYQLQSALSGNFTLGNFTSSFIDRLAATGGATAVSTYTDRPTVVYQPLTGVDFLKRLMTPIPPSSVLFMLRSVVRFVECFECGFDVEANTPCDCQDHDI
jgi:hypothetical protein